MAEEMIQYYVVNKELGMSDGKIAAQVAHAATYIAVDILANGADKPPEQLQWFAAWYTEQGMKKIVLKGTQRELEALIEKGFYPIRDNGHTEVPHGSLTVVGLPPMPRSVAREHTKHLSLL
ncbi:peptidyl-tRNA hydrolase [Paenibacillus sp. TRM 82003]|nr:peptidyl-tRNA hydrolase [Paenibacillus sp. TRM 82003]